MGKKNRQRYIKLSSKITSSYKRTAEGKEIKPAQWKRGMVGVINNHIIRDNIGVPIPYSQLLKGGHYS